MKCNVCGCELCVPMGTDRLFHPKNECVWESYSMPKSKWNCLQAPGSFTWPKLSNFTRCGLPAGWCVDFYGTGSIRQSFTIRCGSILCDTGERTTPEEALEVWKNLNEVCYFCHRPFEVTCVSKGTTYNLCSSCDVIQQANAKVCADAEAKKIHEEFISRSFAQHTLSPNEGQSE